MADYKIYKITNTQNGMVYIGKTSGSIAARWKKHCYAAVDKKRNYLKFKLQYAILEHGVASFTVEQIDSASSKDEANEKEMFWIQHYNSIRKGYNTSPGGRNGGHYKKVMNIETGQVFNSMVDAAKEYGVAVTSVWQAVRNPTWKCCGYHWKAVD